ncbi:MAG: chromate efflux transporter [Ignavibacteria bacterium]|nr:chromate efflux transporter [Ignavibacteria bacterium]
MTNFSIFRYFLYLGFAGFGGPLAIIDFIRKDLVFGKKWMTLEEFREYFGYSQIAPGPLAFQVALYFGYFKKGFWASVLSGIGLVIPSFLIVLLFSVFYKEYKDINYIVWGLYGISPVIISIIFHSGFNLSRSVFTKDVFQYTLFFAAIAVSILYRVHILVLIFSSALIAVVYYFVKEKKSEGQNLKSVSIIAINLISKTLLSLFISVRFVIINLFEFINSKMLEIPLVFMKAGALTYGSGFVIIGVLRQDVVENLHWLTAKEFLDGLAFGQITPGPVVITSTFIGYMVAGIPGSVLATISIFLPTFILVMILAQVIEKVKDNIILKSAIKGANAAAIGAIITTAYFLSKDALIDYVTFGIFAAGLLVLFFTKIKPYYLIISSAIIGIIVRFLF